ncbi:MAG TPA: UDP-N-acetylmuramoyl-tripeptide--D-alanyl-D-alanine ligase [Rhabdochlamydiaceae bacterium]|jgi:UDP-N-acetylmuramoyl-tripeptide--D-alanyl-D-alanine ligase|nr:UDP-N-acetylmuramoyl-tripeptide--D-alanyl-D-alanine ligase [Rhabdochlamydiaceae bacterium]
MKFTKLSQIGQCLQLKVEEKEVTGFCFDSREVKKSDLFFALKGAQFDAHGFLKEVASRGAAAAVVDASYLGENFGLPLLKVPDVVEALHKLAKAIQTMRKQRIVAVTGSVGKTTTKEFIATLLAQKYTVSKTPGNSNSQVALPTAILNADGKEEFFIAEMAMSAPGQIRKLVEIAPPEIAVVTKIGHANIEYFADGFEGIAAAKAEILSHPKTIHAVLNRQVLAYGAFQKEISAKKSIFAVDPEQGDYVLEEGWTIKEGREVSRSFRLPFSATHLCEDFIAAASVARILGLSWEEIISGAHHLKTVDRRFEKIERNGFVIINDCYNASPESMEAALLNLPAPSFGGKTIAVFGEMVDLGTLSEQSHRNIAQFASKKVDHFLCYGKGCLPMLDVFNREGKPAEFFRDLKQLKAMLFEISKPGDVVLIKGSRSNKLWQILEV